MPQVYDSSWPAEELDAYINTYLKEEIKEEAVVRNLVHFSRFLKTVGIANGSQVNFSNIASDTGIPASTVRNWFEILEDTFLAFPVEPWGAGKKRKAVATVKFYLFDVGVANFLKGTGSLERNSDSFGISFEHFIAMELRSYLSYKRIKKELCYWRTHTGQEVDFVIGDDVAVEVKSASRIGEKQLKGLRYLMEENVLGRFFLVSFDEIDRESKDGIRMLHWRSFLTALWDGEIV